MRLIEEFEHCASLSSIVARLAPENFKISYLSQAGHYIYSSLRLGRLGTENDRMAASKQGRIDRGRRFS